MVSQVGVSYAAYAGLRLGTGPWVHWEHIDMAWVTKKRRRGRACRGAARAASVGKSRSRCVRCMCGRAACAYVGLRLGLRLWVLGICRHGLGHKKVEAWARVSGGCARG